jgi:hypothetical protein
MNYFCSIIDKSWMPLDYQCGVTRVPGFSKKFYDIEEAQNLIKLNFLKVASQGGALFIGFTAPVIAWTPQDLEEELREGNSREDSRWYVEVIFLPHVTFGDLLCFLDHLNFGSYDERDLRRVHLIRREAKRLLQTIEASSALSFMELSGGHVTCGFLERLSAEQTEAIFDKAILFNKAHFISERPDAELKRAWRKSNRFTLGPS